MKTHANSISELARILKTSRQRLTHHAKSCGAPGPGPQGYSVEAWREHLDAFGRARDQSGASSPIADQRRRNLQLQNEKIEFQLAAMRKEYIPRANIKRVFTQYVNAAKVRSLSSVSRIVTLARMATDTTDAAVKVREEIIEFWREMENGEWYQKNG